MRWNDWETPSEEVSIETWRGDQDLLSHTQSGAALPVGDLHVRRFCQLSGDVTSLATLARRRADCWCHACNRTGGVYFWGTTTLAGDSSLATDGVVLFVAIQRALAAGTAVLGTTRQVTAGELTTRSQSPLEAFGRHAACPFDRISLARRRVFRRRQMLAVNRRVEDHSPILSDAQVDELFQGLDFDPVDDSAGANNSLVNEIWRMFLVAHDGRMIAEAVLCLPKAAARLSAASSMRKQLRSRSPDISSGWSVFSSLTAKSD